jgi:hypothetical protein
MIGIECKDWQPSERAKAAPEGSALTRQCAHYAGNGLCGLASRYRCEEFDRRQAAKAAGAASGRVPLPVSPDAPRPSAATAPPLPSAASLVAPPSGGGAGGRTRPDVFVAPADGSLVLRPPEPRPDRSRNGRERSERGEETPMSAIATSSPASEPVDLSVEGLERIALEVELRSMVAVAGVALVAAGESHVRADGMIVLTFRDAAVLERIASTFPGAVVTKVTAPKGSS